MNEMFSKCICNLEIPLAGIELSPSTEEKVEEVKEVVTNFDKYMPTIINMLWKVLILVLIWVIGRKVVTWIVSLLDNVTKKKKMDESVRKFLLILLRYVGYVIVFFAMLEYVGVGTTSVVAILGSAGLAVGLALQGSLTNFAGGVIILAMKPFGIGDYIVANGVEGTVKLTGLIYTTITTLDNSTIVIPNGKLADSIIKNSSNSKKRKVVISVGISYKADIKKAKEIMQELINSSEEVLKNEEINVHVSELADSAVIMEMRYWVNSKDFLASKWAMNEKIKVTFDEQGIEIPYNQLDVHVC